MQILVVDDDVFLGDLYTSLLAEIGHEDVEFCSSGYEALSMLRDSTFDLVLTDYRMANGDGGSLSHYCSEHQIPYLVLTSFEESEVRPYVPEDARILNKLNIATPDKLKQEIDRYLNELPAKLKKVD